ncbi:MAG: metallophosphoesterase [Candidatus Altiarchaeota archaeon]|nr:metallophosphoesterase [Candidatus Altiarchaeota archaeon]
MRILCIADIHGDIEAAGKAKEYAIKNAADLVLILGDFPGHRVFHNIELALKEAGDILDVFKGLNVLAIPGNCDPQGIPLLFEERGVNLHEKVRQVDCVTLAGFGGSSPTPFDTPYEMSEEEMYSRLKVLMERVEDKDRMVLALHCPPKDTKCDAAGSGTHAGSASVRGIIEEFQPALALCSHIHEAGGSTDVIGKTRIANIGRLSAGRIGVMETGPSGAFIRLAVME